MRPCVQHIVDIDRRVPRTGVRGVLARLWRTYAYDCPMCRRTVYVPIREVRAGGGRGKRYIRQFSGSRR